MPWEKDALSQKKIWIAIFYCTFLIFSITEYTYCRINIAMAVFFFNIMQSYYLEYLSIYLDCKYPQTILYIHFLNCQRSQHSKLHMSPKQQRTDNNEREETGKAEWIYSVIQWGGSWEHQRCASQRESICDWREMSVNGPVYDLALTTAHSTFTVFYYLEEI